MIRISSRQIVASAASRRCSVTPRSLTEDAEQSVNESLERRVTELREDQISPGTNDFSEIMKFSGPAPELINGRLAMLGFTAGVSAELSSHQTVAQQFADAPGAVLAASILLSSATVIPIIRGHATMDEGTGEGIRPGAVNITNELINGRAAMLGMAAVFAYEWVTGLPLF